MTTVQNRPGEKKSDYILLRSGQLVGTALIVLCLKEIVGDVRNVEMATKKVDSRCSLASSDPGLTLVLPADWTERDGRE